jgi:hypothetical protein
MLAVVTISGLGLRTGLVLLPTLRDVFRDPIGTLSFPITLLMSALAPIPLSRRTFLDKFPFLTLRSLTELHDTMQRRHYSCRSVPPHPKWGERTFLMDEIRDNLIRTTPDGRFDPFRWYIHP